MAKGGNGGGPPKTDSGYIKGTRGNDILSDGGNPVTLAGGRGDDIYLIDNPDTVVEEDARGGIDEVRTALDWRLGLWVENLTLTGTTDATGYGNSLDNVLLGNAGANTLSGLDGDDTLDGGAGNDTLDGGQGNDTLVGGDGSDVALFDGNAGDYELRREGDEIWVLRGAERDVLTGIETLSFADGLIDAATIGATAPPPVAVADDSTAAEDTAVIVRVLDNDQGQGLEIAAANNGAKGLVTVNTDGTVTYRPNANANGNDSFTYTIRDAMGQTDTTTVSVAVAAVNDAPVAVDDAFSTTAGTSLSGSVLANDSDVDGDPLTVTLYDQASAQGGTVSMAPGGTFTYTAKAGFVGADSFSYTASDGNGGYATASVSVTVEATPTADPTPYYVEDLIYSDETARWPTSFGGGTVVTYGFLADIPDYYDWWGADRSTFDAFTEQQRLATRGILDALEEFTGLTFVETAPADAGMAFGTVDLGGTGLAFRPRGDDGVGNQAGDVWLDADYAGDTFTPGTAAYNTLLHEMGHALGLDHPALPAAENTQQYTVMASMPYPTIGGRVDDFRLYDVAALQYLYGANASTAAGDDVYDAAQLVDQVRVIWDGGGRDMIDLSASPYAVAIDLAGGAFSTAHATGSNNIAIAHDAVIEDAVGSAYADTLAGNAVANRLEGGGGDDTLTGGAAADVFVFATDWGSDVVTDFERGADRLDFSGSGLTMGDLQITSQSGDTTVAYGPDTLLLTDVQTVDESDFLF